jgi:hypothetical protein
MALPSSDMLFGKYDKNGAFRSLYAANPKPGVYEWRNWDTGDPAEDTTQKAMVRWRHKALP